MADTFSATSPRGWLMPKALCLTGLVIAILVFLLFFLDLIFVLSGSESLVAIAPFRAIGMLMHLIFLICAGGLGYLAWSAFKELK